MDADAMWEQGLRNRRAVLGEAWVEQSLHSATHFTADYQRLITRYAWGEIWERPGLSHKMRRSMVIAVTLALGRWEEFELHVRAALLAPEPQGLTPDELQEVLLQNAIYAGVPAANTAFQRAQAVLRELGPEFAHVLRPADLHGAG